MSQHDLGSSQPLIPRLGPRGALNGPVVVSVETLKGARLLAAAEGRAVEVGVQELGGLHVLQADDVVAEHRLAGRGGLAGGRSEEVKREG